MTVAPFPGVPWVNRPLHNVTPFTYSDGTTMLQILERISEYLSGPLSRDLSAFIVSVETRITENQEQVDSTLSDLVSSVNEKLLANEQNYKALLDEFIANVENRFGTLAASAAKLAVDSYLASGAVTDSFDKRYVGSSQIRNILRTGNLDVANRAGGETLVAFEGRPGVETNFTYSRDEEILPIYSDSEAWAVGDRNGRRVLSYTSSNTENVWAGAVPRVMRGQYGDVDFLFRGRYTYPGGEILAGLPLGGFIRATGSAGSENFLYFTVQTKTGEDGAVDAGLRLNAVVNGVGSVIPYSYWETAFNRANANRVDTDSYYRIRGVGNNIMAKQWLADQDEPAQWDMMLQLDNVPDIFKVGGSSYYGSVGLFGLQRQAVPEYDYTSLAINGVPAPVQEK